MAERIVVTGGAGFIGSHIVDNLIESGAQVLVVDNLSSGSEDNLHSEAQFVRGDICSPFVVECIQNYKPTIIVHAAAQVSVRLSMDNPAHDVHTNILGLVNILSALKTQPYFLFISSGGAVYGEQTLFPAPETHAIKPESVYGLSKYVSELYLDLWHRVHKLPWSALRLANVYGPRQSAHGEAGVVAIFTELMLNSRVPVINGTGEQTRDFVAVQDIARAVSLLIGNKISGIYNVGTGIETSVNQLYKLIASEVGFDGSPLHGPAKSGEQMRSSVDATSLKQTTGWMPELSLTQGIGATVEWFKKQNVKR